MDDPGESLTPQDLQAGLRQFCNGSATFTPVHPGMRVTEGVLWLCDQAQCYWLLDCIYSYQTLRQVVCEPFQVIDVTVELETKAVCIDVGDGNENIVFTQEIPYTTFPLPRLRLYYTNEVVLLPTEY